LVALLCKELRPERTLHKALDGIQRKPNGCPTVTLGLHPPVFLRDDVSRHLRPLLALVRVLHLAVHRPFSRISEFGCREYKHLQCAYEQTKRYCNFKSAFFDLADPQTIKNQPDLISQYDFATSNQPFSTSPCHKLTQKRQIRANNVALLARI
jgi:hypothetical protein